MTSSPGSPNPACVEYSIVAEEQCFSSLDCRIDVKGPSPGKRIVYFVLKYPAIRPGQSFLCYTYVRTYVPQTARVGHPV